MDFSLIDVQGVEAKWLTDKEVSLDVLRLDKMHAVVSGNKWFKLKHYLAEAKSFERDTIATFGGAWSNHIIAASYAAKDAGLKSIGVIRGEQPQQLSYTLATAAEYGMDLRFISREQYKQKDEIIKKLDKHNVYWIDEGGYGLLGAKGAAEIVNTIDTKKYSHIIAAVGTGTMLAGLVSASQPNQTIIGISSMKKNFGLTLKVIELLSTRTAARFEINHDYHFGRYGKHSDTLISFINAVYLKHQLPLDIIYTGKTFYAIKDMVEKNRFRSGSSLLMIHSGGLQGNRGLPAKVLAF